MSYSALDYLAMQLHQRDSDAQSRVPPRWWCLRAEVRSAYRSKAKTIVERWAADEKATERERTRWIR